MVTITDQKPTMPEVLALYKSVGWSMYTRDPARLERALTHSLTVLSAYEGKQLVGLIRQSVTAKPFFLFRICWFCQNISVEVSANN